MRTISLTVAVAFTAAGTMFVPATAQVGTAQAGTAQAGTAQAGTASRYDHIVVVVEENHAHSDIIGSSSAPYLTALAAGGATMTQSYAVTHPSQPNYLALFSGATQGVSSDSCPHTFAAENLGHQLINAGQSFAGYSETMPSDGYTGCSSGRYVRKHNPWVNFSNLPATSNLRLTAFPSDLTLLPRLAFVIPNLCNDMHDCPVSTGDTWLRNTLGGYATWATTHNSLLVVTFDEDDSSEGNRIPTIFYGAGVVPGSYAEPVTHYTVLRTLQSLTGLGCVANSCQVSPITDIWTS